MLTINISWEFFIGILGTLITLTYYANGRLTRLETNFDWLEDAVRDLSIKVENVSAKAFEIGSPISLTPTGERLLRDSGLKSYIDHRRAYHYMRLPSLSCSLTLMSIETDPALELLTIPEVARLLKISVPSVRRLQQQRRIPFFKVGGRIRFERSDIVAYLQKRRVHSVD